MKTREQALRDLEAVIADELAATAGLTPLQIARRAHHPAGPSIEALAAEISATVKQVA